MAAQTKFEIEDAKELVQQLKNFVDVLSEEFTKVTNQWHNLESTWRDQQYSEFVNDFWDDFVGQIKDVLKESEEFQNHLDHKIQIAEKVSSLGVFSDILTANLPIQIGTTNTVSAAKSTSSPKDQNESVVDKLAESISNGVYKAIGNLRKVTTTSMIFTTMLFGGLVKNYNDIISPAIAVYDEMIAKNPNLPEDSLPSIITKISEQAPNLHGTDLGVEQLDAYQEIRKDKKKEEGERLRDLPEQPEITGGK